MQGRMAIQEHKSVIALKELLTDTVPDVRAACSKALLSLSECRDGCSILMEGDIVSNLVESLEDEHEEAVLGCLCTLVNLCRLDLGIGTSLECGIIRKLQK